MSSASERANGRASGPVLQSVFLAVLDHSEHVLSKMRWIDSSACIRFATASKDHTLRIWSLARDDSAPVAVCKGHRDWVMDILRDRD